MWIRKPASSAVTVINKISQITGTIAVVFLVGMMLLTVTDVFLRYVFSAPIKGSLELTEYAMVLAGFLGIAWCAVKRGHVKVDLVINRLPPRVQSVIDTITLVLAMTVVPLVAWQGFVQARYAQVERAASDFLDIPDYPFYLVVGLGFSLLVLVMVTLLAELIGKVAKK